MFSTALIMFPFTKRPHLSPKAAKIPIIPQLSNNSLIHVNKLFTHIYLIYGAYYEY